MSTPAPASLPSGLVLERVLSSGARSLVLLVQRDGERFVLRLADDAAMLAGEVAPFSVISGDGLVTPIEWGDTPDGRPYVLRRFVPGVPIDEALRAADEQGATRLTASLLTTLAELHDGGFVHRDIKAGNVIAHEGRVYLIDLELVAVRASAGSPQHIAPEVLLGQPHRPASDLFSVGALLAWAFAESVPEDFHERFPVHPFWIAAGIDAERLPAPLVSLARACVRRHPGDRPSSARAAAALLPNTRASHPGSPALPYAAGRALAFDEAATAAVTHAAIVLAVAPNADELERAAEELHLRAVLCDASSARDRRAPASLAVAACTSLDDVLHAWREQTHERTAGCILVLEQSLVADARAALERELFGSERARVVEITLPGVDAKTLEMHLVRISDGTSPECARALARSLVEATQGHWTEIDRCLQHAEARGVLRAAGGRYTLLEERWPGPLTTDADHLAQLASLPSGARSALLAAALLDEYATPQLVESIASSAALGELRAADVLAPGLGAHGQLLCSDRRWFAAARESAPDKTVRALHARCARELDTLRAPAARVAQHRAAASTRTADLRAVLDVAEAERGAGHPAAARSLARAVLGALGRRKSSLRDEATELIARVEIAQGDPSAATAVLVERYGDEFADAPAATLLVAAEAAETGGRRLEARALYERALDRATNRAEVLRANVGIGYALALDGNPAASLERTAGLLRPEDPDVPAGALLNLRAGTLTECGRHDEAHAALDEALARAEASGDPTLLGRTELNRAYLDRRTGRPLEALACLARAREAFDRGDHVKLRALARNNLGVLERDLGRLARAAVLLEEALVLRRRIVDAHGTAVTFANLGILSLDAGRIGEALDRLDQARALMLAGGYEAELAVVETQRALALALAGRTSEAHKLLAESSAAPARKSHKLLTARAQACVAFSDGNTGRAAELLRGALGDSPATAEPAERFRAARMWLALERDSTEARSILGESLSALPSQQRRLEYEWLAAPTAQRHEADPLRATLAGFELEGRSDLVRAVATRLARVLDRSGQPDDRRLAMARAHSAGEALVEGIPPESRASTLRHLALLAGAGDAQGATAGLGVEWLLTWNRRLARDQDLEGLLGATVDRALEITGAQSGFLVLLEGDEIRLQIDRGAAHGLDAGTRFSHTVVREAITSGTPLVTADAGRDERFAGSASIVALELRAILCVPLPDLDEVQGALYLDNDRGGAIFDEFDIEAVRSLTDQAAIAVANLAHRARVEHLNARLRERLAFRDDELASARSLLRESGVAPPAGGSLVGQSQAVQDLLARIERFSGTETPVLISGPRGLGAARVARALHERSERAEGPFLRQNLGAVQAAELEETLFGHASATGRVRPGLLVRAHGGTLFLDGIEELPLALQVQLLDALDRMEVRAPGSARARATDVRLVAATYVDLGRRVQSGDFQRELYHQLAAIELVLPSLAQRVEDVPHLAHQALEALNQRHGTTHELSDEVTAALAKRPWPGELRELEGEVARLYHMHALADVDKVRGPETLATTLEAMPASYRLEDVERAAVARALEATSYNKERTARLLGISRAGLYKKMARLGLHPGGASSRT